MSRRYGYWERRLREGARHRLGLKGESRAIRCGPDSLTRRVAFNGLDPLAMRALRAHVSRPSLIRYDHADVREHLSDRSDLP